MSWDGGNATRVSARLRVPVLLLPLWKAGVSRRASWRGATPVARSLERSHRPPSAFAQTPVEYGHVISGYRNRAAVRRWSAGSKCVLPSVDIVHIAARGAGLCVTGSLKPAMPSGPAGRYRTSLARPSRTAMTPRTPQATTMTEEIIAVFSGRLRGKDYAKEYATRSRVLTEISRTAPGFISQEVLKNVSRRRC